MCARTKLTPLHRHHAPCLFEHFQRAKKKDAKMIRSVDELGGYEALKDSDKASIQKLITETLAKRWVP